MKGKISSLYGIYNNLLRIIRIRIMTGFLTSKSQRRNLVTSESITNGNKIILKNNSSVNYSFTLIIRMGWEFSS